MIIQLLRNKSSTRAAIIHETRTRPYVLPPVIAFALALAIARLRSISMTWQALF